MYNLSIYIVKIIIFFSLMECKVDAGISSSDFLTATKTKYFVDKTLLIKDFINDDPNDPEVKVITAPTRFGKSTVVDMLKIFLSNEFNITGKEVDIKNNANYNIFCNKPLKICKNNSEFMEKHFGKYPVIHINYAPFADVVDFNYLLVLMGDVLKMAFKQHQYILNDDFVLPISSCFTKADIDDYLKNKKEDIKSLQYGLVYLSEFLHEYFGKKVIILLDEYDAHCGELLFGKIKNKRRIINFLMSLNGRLFKHNVNFQKALLTGVLRVKDVGVSPRGNNFKDYRWLGNHVFSKYYGFTEEEVKELVKNNVKCPKYQERVLNNLKKYYDGYSVEGQADVTLYSPISVIEFFNNNMTYDNYWVSTNYLSSISNSYKVKNISLIIVHLINKGNIRINIKQPLERGEINILNKINREIRVFKPVDIEIVFRFFFDIGFLTTEEGESDILKIPNYEIQLEFGRLITLYYINEYSFCREYVGLYQDSFNEFIPKHNPEQAFRNFHLAVYNLFHKAQGNPNPETENDLQSILLGFAAEKFCLGERSTSEYPVKFKGKMGRIDILVLNNHDVAIIIETKFKRKKYKKVSSVELATKGHNDILNKYHPSINITSSLLKVKHLKHVIYIGIGFWQKDRNITIVGSRYDRKKTYTY